MEKMCKNAQISITSFSLDKYLFLTCNKPTAAKTKMASTGHRWPGGNQIDEAVGQQIET